MGTKRTLWSGKTDALGRRVMVSDQDHDNTPAAHREAETVQDMKNDFSTTGGYDIGQFYQERNNYDSPAINDIESITAGMEDVTVNVVTEGNKETSVIVMRGLPGSGKSTIANEWMNADEDRAIVSRDLFRESMYGKQGVLNKNQENAITDMVNHAVSTNIRNGNSVIVDQTSLRRADAREMGFLAMAEDADFATVNVDISVDDAIARNNDRAVAGGRNVPEEVIRGMHTKFGPLSKQKAIELADIVKNDAAAFEPYKCTSGITTPTILFDMDGTLAKMKTEEGARSPYDWDRVDEDDPNEAVINQLRINQAAGNAIVIMSGRDEASREKTEKWLREHDISYDDLLMRPAKDQRKDSHVKREMLSHVEKNYGPVEGIFDDRDQVVDMYRSVGLNVFQVDYGNF